MSYWFASDWAEEDSGPWEGVDDYYDALSDHQNDVAIVIDQDAQVLKTRWISGGVEKVVSTPRVPSDTITTWMARHFTAVGAAQADYPPDKG